MLQRLLADRWVEGKMVAIFMIDLANHPALTFPTIESLVGVVDEGQVFPVALGRVRHVGPTEICLGKLIEVTGIVDGLEVNWNGCRSPAYVLPIDVLKELVMTDLFEVI